MTIRSMMIIALLVMPSIAQAGDCHFSDGTAAYNSKVYSKAMDILRVCAMQGDASAQQNLGVMYRDGQGVQQDYAEAVQWYRKAAAEGVC